MNDPNILVDGIFTDGRIGAQSKCGDQFSSPAPMEFGGEYFYAGGKIKNCGLMPREISPKYWGLKGFKKSQYNNDLNLYNDCVKKNVELNLQNKANSITPPVDTTPPPTEPDLKTPPDTSSTTNSSAISATPTVTGGGPPDTGKSSFKDKWVALPMPAKVGIIGGGVVVIGIIAYLALS